MTRDRQVRIAVVGDLHFDGRQGSLREIFADANREADILALCGDLTTHGEPEQIDGFVRELEGVDMPIVAVMGNHDHESGRADEMSAILQERGVHVLDGDNVVIDGVGFAGVKGFGGGFGRRTLGPFGEQVFKDFVQTAIDESLKLETALRKLDAPVRIALLHYAPIPETLQGEPEQIFPFLGTSRLLPPIETYTPDVVFHGHAHIGAPWGRTPSGIPVFNVATMLLQRHIGKPYRIWTAEAPERRRGRDQQPRLPGDGRERSGTAPERHGRAKPETTPKPR
jgi:Icc-related predicted phosphoesterase